MTPDAPDPTSRGARALFLGVGVGLLGAATLMASLVLVNRESGNDHSFEGARGPVCATIIAIAATVLIVVGIMLTLRNRAPWVAYARAASLIGVLVIGVAAAYFGVFHTGVYANEDRSRALRATWVALVGLSVTTVGAYSPARDAQLTPLAHRVRALAVVGAVLPLVVAGAVTYPWVSADSEFGVEKLDMSPVDAMPDKVDTTPTGSLKPGPPAANANPYSDGDQKVSKPIAVGPGYFARYTVFNADGTPRWRVKLTPDRLLASTAIVSARHNLVVVNDAERPGGPRTYAIDATTGDIKWARTTPLTTWQGGVRDDAPVVAQETLLALTTDARTLTAVSPSNGEVLWTLDVGRDLSVEQLYASPSVAVGIVGPGGRRELWVLDANTGKRTRIESTDDDFWWTSSLNPIATDYRPIRGAAQSLPPLMGVADSRTGRPVLNLIQAKGSHSELAGCTGNGDCLVSVTTTEGNRSTTAVRLVSLTHQHPDVPLRVTGSPRNPVWLRDQIVWFQRASESDNDGGTIVVANRRTGQATTIPAGEDLSLLTVPGAIAVFNKYGRQIARLEGIAR